MLNILSKNVVFLFILTGLIACHASEKNKPKKDIDLSKISIKEIDTMTRKDSVDITFKMHDFADLLSFRYVDFITDTINLIQPLNEFYFKKRHEKLYWHKNKEVIFYPYMKLQNLVMFPPGKFKLFLRNEIIYLHPFAELEYRYNIGHPLILYNRNNDTFNISILNSSLFIEALDTNMVWKPINNKFQTYCGTGVSGINFFPNTFAVIPIPIFKGEFHTKMRVNLNGQYSNEIDANIHYTQFQDDPESD